MANTVSYPNPKRQKVGSWSGAPRASNHLVPHASKLKRHLTACFAFPCFFGSARGTRKHSLAMKEAKWPGRSNAAGPTAGDSRLQLGRLSRAGKMTQHFHHDAVGSPSSSTSFTVACGRKHSKLCSAPCGARLYTDEWSMCTGKLQAHDW